MAPSRSRSVELGKAPCEDTPLLEEHPEHHHSHHHIPALAKVIVPIEVINNSPRICRLAIAHDHVHEHHPHSHLSANDHEREHERIHPPTDRRRQIVGILVLQLGIMIHSLVIGMTLALTSGAEFSKPLADSRTLFADRNQPH